MTLYEDKEFLVIHQSGLRKEPPLFIMAFLVCRHFQVKVCSTLSETKY